MGSGLIFRLILVAMVFVLPFVDAKRHVENEESFITRYLMPEDHPIKAGLDDIFGTTRALFNLQSLESAGFATPKIRPTTLLIVTTHPDFPGYIFKLFMDIQRPYTDEPEFKYWASRISNADAIRELIAERNLESTFKVPHKWLYRLPDSPVPPMGYFKKRYLMVAEDMDLLPEDENEELWASDFVTEEMLTDLYYLLKDLGLQDCTKPGNIPFSRDGKIAFIDTQFRGRKVDFHSLTPFLSTSNKRFWKNLYR